MCMYICIYICMYMHMYMHMCMHMHMHMYGCTGTPEPRTVRSPLVRRGEAVHEKRNEKDDPLRSVYFRTLPTMADLSKKVGR